MKKLLLTLFAVGVAHGVIAQSNLEQEGRVPTNALNQPTKPTNVPNVAAHPASAAQEAQPNEKQEAGVIQGTGTESIRAPQEAPLVVPRAPNSGLGQEEVVEVVIPSAPTVIDESIEDLRSLQINPQQARKLKAIRLERERQRVTPYLEVPKVGTRSVALNLAPGGALPEINLARGFQTSLVFTDGAGNPWNIEHVQMNRQMFSDGGTPPMGHILSLEPQGAVAYGNVTIRLKGKDAPIILLLNGGERAADGKTVDVRVDIRVPGHNPDAPMGTIVEGSGATDGTMLRFLDGDIPPGAIAMRPSSGVWMDAWRFNGSLYVRTKDVVMWPAYEAASKSGSDDGVYVYRFREEVDSDEILGKDSFALTFRNGAYGDVRTVVFSPKIQRAIEGEEALAKKVGRKGKK